MLFKGLCSKNKKGSLGCLSFTQICLDKFGYYCCSYSYSEQPKVLVELVYTMSPIGA